MVDHDGRYQSAGSYLLETLDPLLDNRSVTRAAERLALTQPAVSGMLARLRESFGDPLFIRTQRGIIPTPRAQELAGPVKRVLGEIEGLLQPPDFDPASASLTLSLAATDYALRAVVVPFLSALRSQAPRIRVAIQPIRDDQVRTQLERGELDLALTTPEATSPDLHARPLFAEHYVCALRQGHPDAAGRRLTLDRFCALDHALVSYSGGGFSGATDHALAGLGRQRRVVFSVTSFLILPDILRASDLIAVIPSRLAEGAEGLALLDPPLTIPGFTTTVVWHERTHRNPAHRWVRALLADLSGAARPERAPRGESVRRPGSRHRPAGSPRS